MCIKLWFETKWLLPKPLLRFNLLNCHTGTGAALQQKDNHEKVRKKCKRKRPPCSAVLDHFNSQYGEELGPLWTLTRAVFLDPQSWQYAVMLNRFSASIDVTQKLQSQGFSLLHNGVTTQDTHTLLPGGPISSCHSEYHDNVFYSFVQEPNHQAKPSSTFPPSSLQCYIHAHAQRFPSQAHRPGQLKQYYLINAASVLPVLALQVKNGEKVLDLCSAPGGKAVAIMQSATPAILCCNEPNPHRRDWLLKTLESFLPNSLNTSVFVSGKDGRSFGETEPSFYDKVLVDAPCSNDRSWLYSSSNQQGVQRLKDKSKLPALQAQLLRSALAAVRPGGVVVYSTCTLSSFENWAVVNTVLKDFPQAEPEDLWEDVAISLSKYFTFIPASGHRQIKPKQSPLPLDFAASLHRDTHGLLVVPQPGKTWGPMFVSRIRRKE